MKQYYSFKFLLYTLWCAKKLCIAVLADSIYTWILLLLLVITVILWYDWSGGAFNNNNFNIRRQKTVFNPK